MAAPMSLSKFLLFVVMFTVTAQANFFLSCEKPQCKQITLNATEPKEFFVKALDNGEKKLCVFCYPGQEKAWHKLWINPKVTIRLPDKETHVDIYHGRNVTDVVAASRSSSYLSWPAFSTFLKGEHSFEPFNSSCIGIASEQNYTVYFSIKNPEIWFVAYTAVGLLVFFFAPSWSRNTFLQYSTGVSVGILGSVIIVVFILSKFLPQKLKTVGYVIAATSTSVLMYLFRWVSTQFNDILINYWQLVLGYITVAGLLSFAIVYRYGPISNPRTLNLVKWFLQGGALVVVYHGTQISEMSIAIIAMALALYHFPVGMFSWLKKVWYRYFPPRVRLLTEEEFYREGEVETKKALEELRKYCTSPDCNAWRTISRLSSPNRFASFIEGDSHVSEMEVLDHDATAERLPFVDDDSSESELSFRMTTR